MALTITGLPTGLKYDKKTEFITGAPTKAGEFKVKVVYVGVNYAPAARTVDAVKTEVALPGAEVRVSKI